MGRLMAQNLSRISWLLRQAIERAPSTFFHNFLASLVPEFMPRHAVDNRRGIKPIIVFQKTTTKTNTYSIIMETIPFAFVPSPTAWRGMNSGKGRK
jgi:hypothetical protein